MATQSCILDWRIPWTEEPGSHSPWGHQESDITFQLNSDGKESTCNAGDLCLIPGSGISPGEGNSYQLHSCL